MAYARLRPAPLAECLFAWAQGEEGVDARAGAVVVAEMVCLVIDALTKKPTKGKQG